MEYKTFNRKEILRLLKTCAPGVDVKNPILPGADCYIFRDGKISTFNDHAGVSCPFDAGFTGALPHDTFYALVYGFLGLNIGIAHENGTVHLLCGKAKASIKLMSELVYSRFERLFTDDLLWKPLPKNLTDKLASCVLRGPSDGASGVYLSGNNIYATDTIAIVCEDIDAQMDPLWLSLKAVKQLVKFGDFDEYCRNDSWVHFRREGVQFSTHKLHEENYPLVTVKGYLEMYQGCDVSATIPFNEAFLASMKQALIFADKGSSSKWVGIRVGDKKCCISASGGGGQYSDEFVLDNSRETEIYFQVDLPILLGALGGMTQGEINLVIKKSKRVLHITGPERTAICGTVEK